MNTSHRSLLHDPECDPAAQDLGCPLDGGVPGRLDGNAPHHEERPSTNHPPSVAVSGAHPATKLASSRQYPYAAVGNHTESVMSAEHLKPVRGPFYIARLRPTLWLVGLTGIAAIVLSVTVSPLFLLGVVGLWVLAIGMALLTTTVAYGKERYEIHEDHLICFKGGLLSDARTELDVRNITHVRLRLPWLRYPLFGIGDVRVESAGSSDAEITFASVHEPEAVFQIIQERMRANGFALEKSRVLHEESPGVLGATSAAVQVALVALSTIAFALFAGVGTIADIADGDLLQIIMPLIFGGLVLGALGFVGYLAVTFLDVMRRTYTVYDDTVAYTEGFLTRDNCFIPFENIADASAKRTVIDQILGLYDVNVSCQGSNSEIAFRRLARGEELSAAIRTLVASATEKTRAERTRAAEERAQEAEAGETGPQPKRSRRVSAVPVVAPGEAWTADLRMDMGRVMLGTLPMFWAVPLWVLALIGAAIRTSATTYRVGENSVSSAYSFMGSHSVEFAYDKVTGIEVVRNPFDIAMKTMSIQVWSIGSSQALVLHSIKESSVDLPALLRQCGIDASEPVATELDQSFGPKVWLIQNIPMFLWLLVGVPLALLSTLFIGPFGPLAALALLAIPIPKALLNWLAIKRQRMTFHANHVQCQRGIIQQRHTYARYECIKKVHSARIPLTDQGSLKLFVAGERVLQQQNQQQQQKGAAVPYTIQAMYLEGITAKVDAVDALLLGRIEADAVAGTHPGDDDVIRQTHSALGNLLPGAVISLFLPFLWPLLILQIWRTKLRTYTIESDRVVERGGILFQYATSVLFDRVDSLQQSQGALGKAFGNGVVTLMTAGSSRPDFVIANSPDYEIAYTDIRARYGKAVT